MQRELVRLFVIAIALVAAAALAACSGDAQPTPTPAPAAPVRISPFVQGEIVYEAHCAICHGENAEGQPAWHVRRADGTAPAPPLNGTGHTWHHGDGTLYKWIITGGSYLEGPEIPNFKSAMPAFGETLSHDEVVSVITYLKSLWGNRQARGISIVASQALVSENDPFPPAP